MDDALPAWFRHGIDPRFGGFHDTLDPLTLAPNSDIKRTFAQARQIFVFAEGGRLGWNGPWQEAITIGLASLNRQCRHPDWGYCHSLGDSNIQLETRRSLYDQAFVALAMTTAGIATSTALEIQSGRDLLALIETDWRKPGGGYFQGEMTVGAPQAQNPLMHLLEACVCAARAGDTASLDRANAIAELAANKMIDVSRGSIPEYFSDDWRPALVETGLEPGHHFEWAWLLCRLADAGGRDCRDLAERMWRFARNHGVDHHRNVAINLMGPGGGARSGYARLWPQSERLKAALAMMGCGHADAEAEALAAFDGLWAYLDAATPGFFFDTMTPSGDLEVAPVRSTSLYHIVCAFAELERATA